MVDVRPHCTVIRNHPTMSEHMYSTRFALLALLLCTASSLTSAAGYELTVYGGDVAKAGEMEGEVVLSLARPRAGLANGSGRVWQALTEINYGLGRGWEIGLELPAVWTHDKRRLQGAALEIQYQAPSEGPHGWFWGVRADVGRIASVYEPEAEAGIEINPVIGYR